LKSCSFPLYKRKDTNFELNKLKKACSDFEAIFIYYMLQSMRKTIPQGGLFNKNFEFKIYQSMLDQAISSEIAKRGEFGIGKILYEKLKIYLKYKNNFADKEQDILLKNSKILGGRRK